MIINYRNIDKIKFPIFVLPSDNWKYKDGMLFLGDLVLDDTKMPAKTLGIRRIQSGREDLQPLKKMILTYIDMLKSSKSNFIDSEGRPFTYIKTGFTKLITHRIKIIEKKETASLLWLNGISSPFTIPRPPLNNPLYASLLYLGNAPWQFYSYENSMQATRNKKI